MHRAIELTRQAVLWQTSRAFTLAMIQWLIHLGLWAWTGEEWVLRRYARTAWLCSLLYYFIILALVLSPQNVTTNCPGYVTSFNYTNVQTQLGLTAIVFSTALEIWWGIYAWSNAPPLKRNSLIRSGAPRVSARVDLGTGLAI